MADIIHPPHSKGTGSGAAGAGMTIVSAVAPALGMPVPPWILWVVFAIGVLLIFWSGFQRFRRGMDLPQILIAIGLGGVAVSSLLALGAFIWQAQKPASDKPGQQIAKATASERLIKDPRIEWDDAGRISLKGRYSRHGGPASVYVTYWAANGTQFPRTMPNPVLIIGQTSTEPRIKVDSITHFDRNEGADLTIGFVREDNGKTLQWGQPQQNKTQIGITFANYFGTIVLVWNEGKDEESYPFAIISKAINNNEPGARQPPPMWIGPDALFAQRDIEAK